MLRNYLIFGIITVIIGSMISFGGYPILPLNILFSIAPSDIYNYTFGYVNMSPYQIETYHAPAFYPIIWFLLKVTSGNIQLTIFIASAFSISLFFFSLLVLQHRLARILFQDEKVQILLTLAFFIGTTITIFPILAFRIMPRIYSSLPALTIIHFGFVELIKFVNSETKVSKKELIKWIVIFFTIGLFHLYSLIFFTVVFWGTITLYSIVLFIREKKLYLSKYASIIVIPIFVIILYLLLYKIYESYIISDGYVESVKARIRAPVYTHIPNIPIGLLIMLYVTGFISSSIGVYLLYTDRTAGNKLHKVLAAIHMAIGLALFFVPIHSIITGISAHEFHAFYFMWYFTIIYPFTITYVVRYKWDIKRTVVYLLSSIALVTAIINSIGLLWRRHIPEYRNIQYVAQMCKLLSDKANLKYYFIDVNHDKHITLFNNDVFYFRYNSSYLHSLNAFLVFHNAKYSLEDYIYTSILKTLALNSWHDTNTNAVAIKLIASFEYKNIIRDSIKYSLLFKEIFNVSFKNMYNKIAKKGDSIFRYVYAPKYATKLQPYVDTVFQNMKYVLNRLDIDRVIVRDEVVSWWLQQCQECQFETEDTLYPTNFYPFLQIPDTMIILKCRACL